ncbi:uncharacterized protein BX663DRAFT_500736 [Cokeromyces recurvatus]|uniref:uncharacterized protein n=1 Tax=Cokeromyces recurvatus TaxID=90255 RepID=UPI0022206C75|nr:uncharacterized protein BX663DRAFT_500736 [Cokeromyces recurvatus]KAI7905736.1 hypothetical protein BX663DRAFT_500736 [Cokeromyces recurvatus]
MKRGMGGSNGTTTSGRKHNENGNDDGNSYTSHKQFRKFIDATISNNNHLFTIFRMNPTTTTTTTTTTATATENSKKQRTNKKMKKEQEEQKQEQPIEQQDPIYDSDCDSGVDLNCEVLPKKEGMSIPPSSIQNQASLNSLFMENSMFVPDDLLLTQQPNTNRTQNCFLDSMIDTTTTSFYDPIEYWDAPPPPPQTSLFDFTQSQQPMMLPQQQGLVDYYCNEPTTFNSYVTTLNQQPPQDFFLYNNFC